VTQKTVTLEHPGQHRIDDPGKVDELIHKMGGFDGDYQVKSSTNVSGESTKFVLDLPDDPEKQEADPVRESRGAVRR
jgi:hypothetical protein